MASSCPESQDRSSLYRFTNLLTLKVAQIIVQSRQGKKITHDCDTNKQIENVTPSSATHLQWFSLSIPDEPEVNYDMKKILNGEIVEALSKVLCIEISLRTNDGDEMVLELWTLKMIPCCDLSISSISTIYYRMSIMLKSTLSISRITPAYKMSRSQSKETYKIFHKIYGGQPNVDLLGEKYKTIKVSELRTPIGTILIEVLYRTKMTLVPNEKPKVMQIETSNNNIMVKSDHFLTESPKRASLEQMNKKEIDLSKPLTAGAFVDVEKIMELHNTLSQQLLPEPPMSWMLEKEDAENKTTRLAVSENVDISKPGVSNNVTSSSAPNTTKAIEVPKIKNGDKYNSLMEFPFADGSPLTELATFYQECLHARSVSDEWTEVAADVSGSTDSETLSRQLKMFEDAVPEFDNMVASMFSNSENSDNS